MRFLLGTFISLLSIQSLSFADSKKRDIWESYCVSTKTAVGEQVIKLKVENDAKKWNDFLAQEGRKGWEPVQFLYVPDRNSTPIMSACFKRRKM